MQFQIQHVHCVAAVAERKINFFITFHQISDVEQNVGLMHVEQVVINAEAYDVALDISFPKGQATAMYQHMYLVFVGLKPLYMLLFGLVPLSRVMWNRKQFYYMYNMTHHMQ